MRQLCELVGVTYGEFQSWYSYGEIRLSADRLVPLEVREGAGGIPDAASPHVAILLERIPQLSLEDEEGVLVVQLGRPTDSNNVGGGVLQIDPRTIRVSAERIQRVIPLTERASRILEPRLSPLGVRLDLPHFHEQVRGAWFRMGVRRALLGGNALADALFEEGTASIGEELKQAVACGIWALDHRDEAAISSGSPCGPGVTWVSDAFAFTRHEPYDKGNLNYLLDAGVVLRKCADRQDRDDSFLEPYRQAMKDLSERVNPSAPVPEILAGAVFKEVALETEAGFREAFPVGLGSLVVFLRWKELFHKAGEEVDVEQLAGDVPDFVDAIGFDSTVAAAWLLGCFAGHERIAPAVYAANPQVYHWFSGPSLKITKTTRPKPKESTAAPRTSAKEAMIDEARVEKPGGGAANLDREELSVTKEHEEAESIRASEKLGATGSEEEVSSNETEGGASDEASTSVLPQPAKVDEKSKTSEMYLEEVPVPDQDKKAKRKERAPKKQKDAASPESQQGNLLDQTEQPVEEPEQRASASNDAREPDNRGKESASGEPAEKQKELTAAESNVQEYPPEK